MDDPRSIIEDAVAARRACEALTQVRVWLAEVADPLLRCRTPVLDDVTLLPRPCAECTLCRLRAEAELAPPYQST